MKEIKQAMKSIDMYGYPVFLSFDKNSDKHKTFIGGFCTILSFVVLLVYFSFGIIKIIYHQQSVTSSILQVVDLKKLGQVNFNQTKMLIFHQIKSTQFGTSIQDLQQYLDIYFEEEYKDYYAKPTLNRLRRVPAKWCTQDDFGYDQQSIHEFESWAGTFIICPDLSMAESYQLSDDGFGMRITTINSYFKQCNQNVSQCQPQDQIENFIKNLRVKTYSWNQNVDFLMYGEEPIFRSQQIQSIIYPGSLISNTFQGFQYYFRLNNILTYDAFLQYGQISQQAQFYDLSRTVQYTQPQTDSTLIKFTFQLDVFQQFHNRKAYSLLDLLTNIGGMSETFTVTLTILIVPFSQQSFILKAILRLFLQRYINQENTLNEIQKSNPQQSEQISKKIKYIKKCQEQINQIKNLSFKQQILLCLSTNLRIGQQCYNFFWDKHEDIKQVFESGRQKIIKELNVVHIMNMLYILKHHQQKINEDQSSEFNETWIIQDHLKQLPLDQVINNEDPSNENENSDKKYLNLQLDKSIQSSNLKTSRTLVPSIKKVDDDLTIDDQENNGLQQLFSKRNSKFKNIFVDKLSGKRQKKSNLESPISSKLKREERQSRFQK